MINKIDVFIRIYDGTRYLKEIQRLKNMKLFGTELGIYQN